MIQPYISARFVAVENSFLLSATYHQISPGKNAHFHLIYLPHLPLEPLIASGFALFGKLAQLYRPHAIRVPQTETLPPTSFRFAVTRDTLVFG
jgi:hypothetical protein